MSSAAKMHGVAPSPPSPHKPHHDRAARREMWITVAMWVAVVAVFATLVWLSMMMGTGNGVPIDYWPMP